MDHPESLDLTHEQKRMREVAQTAMHEATLQFYLSFLDVAKSAIVLDLGAGNGAVATRLTDSSYVTKVTAYDRSLEAMRLFDETPKLEKECRGSTSALPFSDNTFEAVICRYTLHHMEDKSKSLHEMRRVLKKGGLLLISDAIFPEHSRNVLSGIYRIREDHYCGYTTYYELIEFLEDAKFEPVRMRPYRYRYPNIGKYLEAVTSGAGASVGANNPAREILTAAVDMLKWKIQRALFSVDSRVQREMKMVIDRKANDLSFEYFMVDVAATLNAK